MHSNKGQIHIFYFFIDVILIGFSFFLAYLIKYPGAFLDNLVYLREYFFLYLFWGLCVIFLLKNYRLYTTDRSLTIPAETLKTLKSVGYSSILAAVAIFGLKLIFFSREIFIWSTAFLAISLSLWRILKRVYVRNRLLKGHDNFNILIIGAGKAAGFLIEEIDANPYLGLRIKGLLDDTKEGEFKGYKILGATSDLERIVHQKFIDEIFITIPSERNKIRQILLETQNLHKTVRVLADNYDFDFNPVEMNYLGVIPLLAYYEKSIQGAALFFKRLLDVLVSLVALIVLAPLFLILCIFITLDSPGPIFYVSDRVGFKGKKFRFYKFRTMVSHAEKIKHQLMDKNEVKGGVIFKIKEDPRITRVGRLLRRYSLDELPQLFNVIKGDMSLVGPRPPTPDEVAMYDYTHMTRLAIRPGITGLSQVRGRSDLSFYRWVKWDIWYINNWSFGLDLRILLWTIPTVLHGRGAY